MAPRDTGFAWLEVRSDLLSAPVDAGSGGVAVRACTPGERRCGDPMSPEFCLEDGSAWEPDRVCPTGGTCDPQTCP